MGMTALLNEFANNVKKRSTGHKLIEIIVDGTSVTIRHFSEDEDNPDFVRMPCNLNVRCNIETANIWRYPSLTDGKIYEVEEISEWFEGEMRYWLIEDDHDEQEPYDVSLFDIVRTWTCTDCGNVNWNNSEYGENNFCVLCNWDAVDKWGSLVENHTLNSLSTVLMNWKCPVCDNSNAGEHSEYDICPKCGWENDPLQRDEPDYWGGANQLSLNESRLEYKLSQDAMKKLQAKKALESHREERAKIYMKYKGIDYRVDGDKIHKELKEEHDRYVLMLKEIDGTQLTDEQN